MAPALLLSPHPDDAVLDCWSVLAGPGDLRVVNVFAGVPVARPAARTSTGSPAPPTLRRTCAADRGRREALRPRSAARPRSTSASARSCTAAGARSRRSRGSTRRSARTARAVRMVYAPAALGEPHPDHELLRCYALALARSGRPGAPLRGPARTARSTDGRGGSRATSRDPAPRRRRLLARVARRRGGRRARPAGARWSASTADEAAAKLAAMRRYRDFAVLDRGPVGQLSNPAIHAFEVFWPAATGRLRCGVLVITDLFPPVAFGGYERSCAVLVDGCAGATTSVLTSDLRRRDAPASRGCGGSCGTWDHARREALRVPARGGARRRRDPPGAPRDVPRVVYVWNCLGASQAAPCAALHSGTPMAYRLSELWFASSLYRPATASSATSRPGGRGLRRPWSRLVRTRQPPSGAAPRSRPVPPPPPSRGAATTCARG